MAVLNNFKELEGVLGESNLEILNLIKEILSEGEEVLFIFTVPAEPPEKEDYYFILTNIRIIQFTIHNVLNKRNYLRWYYLWAFNGIVYKSKTSGENKIEITCTNSQFNFEINSKEELRTFYKEICRVMDKAR